MAHAAPRERTCARSPDESQKRTQIRETYDPTLRRRRAARRQALCARPNEKREGGILAITLSRGEHETETTEDTDSLTGCNEWCVQKSAQICDTQSLELAYIPHGNRVDRQTQANARMAAVNIRDQKGEHRTWTMVVQVAAGMHSTRVRIVALSNTGRSYGRRATEQELSGVDFRNGAATKFAGEYTVGCQGCWEPGMAEEGCAPGLDWCGHSQFCSDNSSHKVEESRGSRWRRRDASGSQREWHNGRGRNGERGLSLGGGRMGGKVSVNLRHRV
ncbi:hypothetical protein FGB62_110g111 [Gracilaria domingensis]|nr:hypothetical protein FGB62_110g111 [Gracilaria domingensis]